MARFFTVGHGRRTTDDLVGLLKEVDVELLVDVRRFPGSRKHPHFTKESLQANLASVRITYSWRGEELGGRRSLSGSTRHSAWRTASFRAYADHMDGDFFREELERLEKVAKSTRIAFMCAETLWWRCHRRLIADVLVLRGHEVLHIMALGKTSAHPVSPWARKAEDGWIVYDQVPRGAGQGSK